MTVSETDREIMGTPAAAKADLIAKAKVWRATRQPLVASRAEHRKVEASEHEARFQLANAALHWLWHEENPALTAALSDQAGEAHEWHIKPTTVPDEMFKRPVFVADALRKMVANCVSLHAVGSSLYTDGERKAMLAAAEHIEAFVAAAPPPSSTVGDDKS